MTTSDHESELATLRARVEELERENRELRTQDDPAFTHAFKLRAEAATARAARLQSLLDEARKALEFVRRRGLNATASFVRRSPDAEQRMAEVLNVIDAALDRLTNIMGESDG